MSEVPQSKKKKSTKVTAKSKQQVDPADVGSVLSVMVDGAEDKTIQAAFSDHIDALVAKYGLDNYQILFLIDEEDEIQNWHSNRIYGAASTDDQKDILLILQSRGGQVEPAYLISKTCKSLAKSKFVVAVPRKAKSAATLISLGAEEIHMGLMSELGPIDPQFGGLPGLGIHNSLKIMANLACEYPGASDMFGKFLAEKLDLRILGYFERVSESAVQYAERLLAGKQFPKGKTPEILADHFVNHYKDHGFVIDGDEAVSLLGDQVVKLDSTEYQLANEVHQSLDLMSIIMKFRLKKKFDLVGNQKDGLRILPIKS